MMKKYLPLIALALAAACRTAAAGPDDPSKFDATPYKPQKAVYDFNFAKPLDGKAAFGYVRNHLEALKKYGDVKNSHIVIVAHGNELHAFSRLNRAAYPGVYEDLKALADAGVTIRVCGNAARSRGYKPDEFYDVITVAPAAVSDLAKWQNQGYSYMYAEMFPRVTRDDIVKQYPELQ
ncbi:DsrE family protein [Ramlibacter sp.]|jgi:intracellular sulfur oxidation DsrE/DsrF family protein|uniref:DsrE family protein n=1 Tax=Ramlibacter sp. TaxID=1917967 RepID=UPI00262AD7BA|nr:DsrE family protein [Ramlibacter sp.]